MLRRLVIPIWLTGTVIAAAVVARYLPHPWNLTPVGAMFLFCGFAAARPVTVVAPLAAYAASDLGLNTLVYHTPFGVSTLFVWLGFMLVWTVGRALKAFASLWWLYPAALASAVIFFLVSNFGVWLSAGMYPPSLAGLVAAYAAGLPFFQPTLIGDLVYGTLFFGVALALSARPMRQVQRIP